MPGVAKASVWWEHKALMLAERIMMFFKKSMSAFARTEEGNINSRAGGGGKSFKRGEINLNI